MLFVQKKFFKELISPTELNAPLFGVIQIYLSSINANWLTKMWDGYMTLVVFSLH